MVPVTMWEVPLKEAKFCLIVVYIWVSKKEKKVALSNI